MIQIVSEQVITTCNLPGVNVTGVNGITTELLQLFPLLKSFFVFITHKASSLINYLNF